MKQIFIFLFFIGVVCDASLAQSNTDSTQQVLTWEEFYKQIIEYHPIAKQAWLLDELAQQELRLARGGFDPKAKLDYSRKEFKGSTYYNLWDSKLKIPLWVGEVQVGYEQNNGVFLNPENSISDPSGQGSIGIAVPIGQGLVIDSRRATLRQARFFQDIARADQIKAINKLLISAAKDYWSWYFSTQEYRLLDEAYTLARQRYEAVKLNIRLGESAPIDSVDAKTLFQDRNIAKKLAQIKLQNARIQISNYLWAENDTPLILADNVVPQTFEDRVSTQQQPKIDDLRLFALQNHPEITKSIFKLKQIEVEEKLQRFNLLPKVDLKYNLLRNINNVDESTNFNFQNNYKFGVNFEFPIFLRKERGKLQMVRIKQSQSEFDLQQTRLTVENDLQAAYNDFINLTEIITLQVEVTNNYRLLRDAELRKYRNGESSLFVINLRETKLIEAQVKLAKQKADYQKAYMMLYWTAGQPLWENIP